MFRYPSDLMHLYDVIYTENQKYVFCYFCFVHFFVTLWIVLGALFSGRPKVIMEIQKARVPLDLWIPMICVFSPLLPAIPSGKKPVENHPACTK